MTVLGNELILEGFDLKGLQVAAKWQNGRQSASVSLEAVEFSKLLWMGAVQG